MKAGEPEFEAGRRSWTSRRCVLLGLVTVPSQSPKPRIKVSICGKEIYVMSYLRQGRGSYVHEARKL